MADLPQKPSHQLTFDDAIQVWMLRSAGLFQNRIAALFDCNSARVNDVLKERLHEGSKRVAERIKKLRP